MRSMADTKPNIFRWAIFAVLLLVLDPICGCAPAQKMSLWEIPSLAPKPEIAGLLGRTSSEIQAADRSLARREIMLDWTRYNDGHGGRGYFGAIESTERTREITVTYEAWYRLSLIHI